MGNSPPARCSDVNCFCSFEGVSPARSGNTHIWSSLTGASSEKLNSECATPVPAASAVFVPQRAFQHVGHDLHLAMRMRRKSSSARDRVMVEDAQRPESHVVRVVVAVETEQPVRRQPVALQMKSVFGLNDLHISSSYRFYFRRNYFARHPTRDRSKMRRANNFRSIFLPLVSDTVIPLTAKLLLS